MLGFASEKKGLLSGIHRYLPGKADTPPSQPVERPLDLGALGEGTFANRMLTGVQLLFRSNFPEARALIAGASREASSTPDSPFRAADARDAVTLFGLAVLDESRSSPRAGLAEQALRWRRVEQVLRDLPALRTADALALARSLREAASYQDASPADIEAAIEDCLVKGEFSSDSLALLGFKAVPAILSRLDREYPANHPGPPVNNDSFVQPMAGKVFLDYLSALANRGLTRESAEAWWKEASVTGEEAYLTAHIIGSYRVDISTPRLGGELLEIASARYPRKLSQLYRQVMATNIHSDDVALAIVDSEAFTKEEKLALLREGLACQREHHQRSALRALARLDSAVAAPVLVEKIDAASPTLRAKIHDIDPTLELAEIAGKSPDPSVWEAIHRFLDRAETPMRVEFIDRLAPQLAGPSAFREQVFKLYDRFSTDRSSRNLNSDQIHPTFPVFTEYKELVMVDFIHMKFAAWLGLKVKAPTANSSVKEWMTYHNQVRGTVEKAR